MENHPIPQDVTGFQFRLIGQMTVKQFAFLAVAAIGVAIVWYLPVHVLFKVFLIPLFGLSGFAFAFIPIEGRPLDLMAGNFLKALFSPNQYVFHKNGGSLDFLTVSLTPQFIPTQQTAATKHVNPEEVRQKEEMLSAYLADVQKTKDPLDTKESSYLTTLFDQETPTTPTQITPPQIVQVDTPPPVTQNTPVPEVPTAPIQQVPPSQPAPINMAPAPAPAPAPQLKPEKNEKEEVSSENEETLANEAKEIEHELELAKMKEAAQQSADEGKAAHEKVVELDKKLQDILSEKEKLEQELISLKKELGRDENATAVKTPSQATLPETQLVRKIPQNMSRKVGLPTPPDSPNVLMGIVKDPRGNVLPNILVEVKDKEDNPVRAFKTNPVGQFASATPLKKGVYTLVFEDPQNQHKFELIELTVNDQVIQPLEIISVDAREELRQQLFN